jgi:hypothetical protein
MIVTVIARGAVDTAIRRAAAGAEIAARDLAPIDSVAVRIKTIDGLSRADSDRALNYADRATAWRQPTAAPFVSWGSAHAQPTY